MRFQTAKADARAPRAGWSPASRRRRQPRARAQRSTARAGPATKRPARFGRRPRRRRRLASAAAAGPARRRAVSGAGSKAGAADRHATRSREQRGRRTSTTSGVAVLSARQASKVPSAASAVSAVSRWNCGTRLCQQRAGCAGRGQGVATRARRARRARAQRLGGLAAELRGARDSRTQSAALTRHSAASCDTARELDAMPCALCCCAASTQPLQAWTGGGLQPAAGATRQETGARRNRASERL